MTKKEMKKHYEFLKQCRALAVDCTNKSGAIHKKDSNLMMLYVTTAMLGIELRLGK